MRAKPRIGRLLVVVLILSLVLGACGGGTTGSTWFNLPSVKLAMNDNGTAKIYGIPLNQVILDPSVIQMLQSADVQRLEARIGYNGIHVYLNGEDMPYIAWDATSTENLQSVLNSLPPTVLPNGAMIAKYLPWLRKIGLGVKLDLPPADMNIANWSGETAVTPESPEATTIGPLVIGSLVFDDNGEAIIEGIPVSQLEQSMGTTLPLRLDAGVLAILDAIGADSIKIATQPNGIDIFLNEDQLPGIAYDSAYLERTIPYINAFVTDPAMADLLDQLIPQLPGADVQVVVSFTGEPAVATDLGSITLVASEDGSLRLENNVPLPAATLPSDMLANLQKANVQQLGVNMSGDTLAITANGQVLPTISISEDSMGTLAGLVGPMAGVDPSLITEGVNVLRNLGPDVKLDLPAAEGAEPIEIPEQPDLTMKPAQIGDVNAPTIQLSAKYGPNGFTEIGGVSSDTLDTLGIALPTLPPDVVNLLTEQGVGEVQLVVGDGALHVITDGETALTVNYDTDSLQAALDIASPFLGEDSPLNQPVMSRFIEEQLLPILPAANVVIRLELE